MKKKTNLPRPHTRTIKNPRTVFRWDIAQKQNVYHGLKLFAAENDFVLVPYNKTTIYLRHYSTEDRRDDHKFSILGISGNLSYMARLVMLWLEYYSVVGKEVLNNERVEISEEKYHGKYLYSYPTLEQIKELCGFPLDKNDLYFRQKIRSSVTEISKLSYNFWDGKSTSEYIPVLDPNSSAFENGKKAIEFDNMLEVKLSDAHQKTFEHLMIYPKIGLELYNERDEILFYLISYLSYRYANFNKPHNNQMKISGRALLEHIPVFKSPQIIKEQYNSKYKEMVVRPLWENICRLPDTALTEFWNGNEFYTAEEFMEKDECPTLESMMKKKAYFLFDVSSYNEAIKSIIKNYNSV